MKSLEQFQNQLDLLIGLLNISDSQVYEIIKDHKHLNLGVTMEQMFDHKFENYSNLITTSVLILGLSHFEDFIGKCISVILVKNPDRNDLRTSLKVIREKGAELVSYLADEQAKKMPFSEKVTFIEKNLPGVNVKTLNEIKFVYNIRNCIMHNNGHADTTLISKYSDKEKISLNPDDVNSYGLLVRQAAKDVWDRLNQTYAA